MDESIATSVPRRATPFTEMTSRKGAKAPSKSQNRFVSRLSHSISIPSLCAFAPLRETFQSAAVR
jgi:hypothetical protein